MHSADDQSLQHTADHEHHFCGGGGGGGGGGGALGDAEAHVVESSSSDLDVVDALSRRVQQLQASCVLLLHVVVVVVVVEYDTS